MKSDPSPILRRQLIELLKGGSAHATFAEATAGFPAKLRGRIPPKLSHSAWMLLEHLRIAQWDILEFSTTPGHVSPPWPQGYWPSTPHAPQPKAWGESIRKFEHDLLAMQKLVANRRTDLFRKIPWGDGQTILRQALLTADHNAYHLAQLVDVRRLLGGWKK
jgi:hypothetical protein